MTLLDVGVWLAAVWARHVHHPVAASWFEAQTTEMALCRVTQMSLLRLLTNPSVMGDDALARRAAWKVLDTLRSDDRVVWAEEPLGLEALWRAFSSHDQRDHELWTDDYLAAFAQAGDLSLVTLDRATVRRYPSVRVTVLT